MKNRLLIIIEPQAHKKLNPSLTMPTMPVLCLFITTVRIGVRITMRVGASQKNLQNFSVLSN